MFCSIYIIRNSINDKVYIGQTWNPIQRRLSEHIRHRNDKKRRSFKLSNAMNKYGVEKFSITLLTIVHTQKVADYWENYFIKKYNSISMGYNIKNGGSNGKHSEKTKQKMSEIKLGKTFSDAHKSAISEAKSGKTNKHLIGNTIWLGKNHTDESKKKMSLASKGKPKSEEHKKKLSEAAKKKRLQ